MKVYIYYTLFSASFIRFFSISPKMTVIFEIFVLSIFTYNFCDAQYLATFGNRSKKTSAYPSAPYSGGLQGGSAIYDSTTFGDRSKKPSAYPSAPYSGGLHGGSAIYDRTTFGNRSKIPSAYPSAPYRGGLQCGSALYDCKNLDTVNSEIRSLKENYYSLLHESHHHKENLDTVNSEIKSLKENYYSLLHESHHHKENYNSLNAEMQVIRENLTLMIGEITSKKEVTDIMPIDGEECCPPPYKLRGTECFFVHEDKSDLLDWIESRERCLIMKGDLAQPQDMADFMEYIKKNYPNSKPLIWIGAKELKKGWHWLSGEPVVPAKWPFGEPSGDGDCMNIYISHGGRYFMNDHFCNVKGYFVCEFNMTCEKTSPL